LPGISTLDGLAAVAAGVESSVVTFGALSAGQAVTVNGLSLTAGTSNISAEAVTTFFAAGTLPTGATAGGANNAAFTKAAGAGANVGKVVYTAAAAGVQADIVISTAGNTVGTAQATALENTRDAV
jgi:hypothetical protein